MGFARKPRVFDAAAKASHAGGVITVPDILAHLKCPVSGSAKREAAYVEAIRGMLERKAARAQVLDDSALIVSEE